MNALLNSRLTAPVSLAAGALAVLVMTLWGFNALTAPVDDDPAATRTEECTGAKTDARFLTRGEVTVSVYNSGKRSGRAGAAMDLLEAAGFRAGAVGNAPAGNVAEKARVYSTKETHPEATLVARAFGKQTPVFVIDDDMGPGVDVVIGDKFNKLVPNAIKRIKVAEGSDGC